MIKINLGWLTHIFAWMGGMFTAYQMRKNREADERIKTLKRRSEIEKEIFGMDLHDLHDDSRKWVRDRRSD